MQVWGAEFLILVQAWAPTQLSLRNSPIMGRFKHTCAQLSPSSVLKCHSLLCSGVLTDCGVAYLFSVYPLKSLWWSDTCEKWSTHGLEHGRLMGALHWASPLCKRNGRQTPSTALTVEVCLRERGRGRSTDRVTIHTRGSKQTLHHRHVSLNIIWQRVHFSCRRLCTRKPNRLEEVCCSQTASLLGSNPSAHRLQPRKQSHSTYEQIHQPL